LVYILEKNVQDITRFSVRKDFTVKNKIDIHIDLIGHHSVLLLKPGILAVFENQINHLELKSGRLSNIISVKMLRLLLVLKLTANMDNFSQTDHFQIPNRSDNI
jgi:hypothetical protein